MRSFRGGALLAALSLCLSAHAQTFTATPATGPSPLGATLAWAAPANATNCQASGSWTGSKPSSGSQSVTGLTAKATYTINCDVSGAPVLDSVALAWTTPTQNTDGTPLTDLAGYILYQGISPSDISTKVKDINSATVTSYVVTGLPDGTYYWTILAYNSANGRGPVFTPPVSKTLKSTVPITKWTASIDVVPIASKLPKAPVLSVQ